MGKQLAASEFSVRRASPMAARRSASSASVFRRKTTRGRGRQTTWARSCKGNTGTRKPARAPQNHARCYHYLQFGTIEGSSLRLVVQARITSSKTSWMARWRKRQEWWNKFPPVALMAFWMSTGAAPDPKLEFTIGRSYRHRDAEGFQESVKTKTRSFSIWVLSVGQSISEYVVSMGRRLICWYWWKTKEITFDSTRPNP